MQKPAAPGLVVVGEADYKILLVHKLCSPDKYTRQGGVMIYSHHAATFMRASSRMLCQRWYMQAAHEWHHMSSSGPSQMPSFTCLIQTSEPAAILSSV